LRGNYLAGIVVLDLVSEETSCARRWRAKDEMSEFELRRTERMEDEMPEFEDKVAIITGGGGGIGRATAARLLAEGASVVLSGRRREVLQAAQRALDPASGRVELLAGDVSSPAAAARLVESALERFGGVDVLVNSTGIFRPVPFLEQTEEHVEEALNSILRPTFYTSQAAAKAMVEGSKGGAIVNVGSMWAMDAITATPTSAYSAAQAGRHALTKNLAIELAPHGIRVNTVALAFVETPAYERFMTREQARQVLDSVNGFHPLGRRGQPEDVVEAILFYASDRARWITGTTMPIDGGVLAGRNAPPAPLGRQTAA
jgi:NAD(P)-dependent dehydrogenase (short-subunit alcohol dehydrogenase family)